MKSMALNEPPIAPSVMEKSSLTAERYAELVQIGLIAKKELLKHGLQRQEFCEFGRIMDKLMQLE